MNEINRFNFCSPSLLVTRVVYQVEEDLTGLGNESSMKATNDKKYWAK